MPDIDQRDPAEVADVLGRWLATKSPDGTGPEVFDVRAPASNGFSNETILCRTRSADGEERRLVVRVAPTKHLLFMDAEFSTQYRVMKALADGGSGVPLPRLGFYEEDPQYLGVPFFTMDHVEGRVPSDNIPYTMEGWVIEATPEEQERLWWSGIDALAAVHRTDWRALGLDWLGMPTRGKPGIEQQMSYYRDFLDWAAKGLTVPVHRVHLAVAGRPSPRRGRATWCSAGATAASATSFGTTSAAPPSSTGRWRRSASPRWISAGTSTSTASSPIPLVSPGRPDSPRTRTPIERYAELLGRP